MVKNGHFWPFLGILGDFGVRGSRDPQTSWGPPGDPWRPPWRPPPKISPLWDPWGPPVGPSGVPGALKNELPWSRPPQTRYALRTVHVSVTHFRGPKQKSTRAVQTTCLEGLSLRPHKHHRNSNMTIALH